MEIPRYKVMVVDDEADAREGIARRIDWASLGFDAAIEAENGQDALEKAESCSIDVVLTDIKMPFMDGLEMSRRLIQLYPGLKIIMLSGFDEFEYAKEAIKLNVVEYVLKPVNVAELTEVFARVKKLLDDATAQQRNIDYLRQNYKNSLPLMRTRFLTELLWGAVKEKDIEPQLQEYGISVGEEQRIAVAAFSAEKMPKTNPVVSWDLISVSIQKMIEEQMEGRCKSVVFTSSSDIIAITAWASSNPISELLSIADEICARCARVLNVSVTAGVGRCYSLMREVHESFVEARAALEYKIIAGAGRAIYIRDMERMRQEKAAPGAQEEEQLLFAVKFGNSQEITECAEILAEKARDMGEWRRQAYMLSLFSVIYRIIDRYELYEEPGIKGLMEKFMSSQDKWRSWEWMGGWMEEICLQVRESLNAERESVPKNLVEKAKLFIGEHYSEHELSVDRLCEHLHLSQSYFSTIFRQETGASYVQYLTELRMNKAQELLRQTNGKTYEIARLVGYEEPNYFSYVFKKWFGISPTRYRSSLQGG
ncbi:MAG: response regulator [Clostridiales bacterium]|jgi:two-component system response regulator YesN|nr:response regulator [Clostridiales bacterium]